MWESATLLRVGRLETLEMSLTDVSVSRIHAEIRQNQEGWFLRDVGSTNGTFLNGERLAGWQGRQIIPGDNIRFGSVAFRVRGFAVRSGDEWDTCAHPLSMLEALAHVDWSERSLDRRLRLWAIHCIRMHGRRLLSIMGHQNAAALHEIVELLRNHDEFDRLREHLRNDVTGGRNRSHPLDSAVSGVLAPRGGVHEICQAVDRSFGIDWEPPELQEKVGKWAASADLLRCAFGNPWRPLVIDPSLTCFDGGAIPSLARAIERDGAINDLPILADALEDAGCVDKWLLGHLRSGPHFRTCHAIDYLMGRKWFDAPNGGVPVVACSTENCR